MSSEFVTYGGESPAGCPKVVWKDLCDVCLPRVRINLFTPALNLMPVSTKIDEILVEGIFLGHNLGGAEFFLEYISGSVWLGLPWEFDSLLVNSSLVAFRQSLLQVDSRCPFKFSGEIESAWVAADELRELLVEIDPKSMEDLYGYWPAFLEDVAVGDYSVGGNPD
ncbi:SUKH-4 family immunity protein [Actinoplanes sp. HUAS TT8]|uniref:SUKH-4 family immunity protein n=1 Tax=Actinoplanes sp. HUAS TT8 TaxID=3447453 RepID=UPI003F51E71E